MGSVLSQARVRALALARAPVRAYTRLREDRLAREGVSVRAYTRV